MRKMLILINKTRAIIPSGYKTVNENCAPREYEIFLSDIWSEKKLPFEYLVKAIELIKAMFNHG